MISKEIQSLKEKIKIVDDKKLIQESYYKYLQDESKLLAYLPERIFFPKTTQEVSIILKLLYEHDEKITISGGRTGITGGATPARNSSILTLEKLEKKAFLYYKKDINKWILQLSANTTLLEIENILKNKNYKCDYPNPPNLFYPVDPTEKEATIGGMVSTNASGARTLYYGPTRNWVHALTVVLADGTILKIERGKYYFKNGKLKIKTNNKNLILKIKNIKIPKTKHVAGYYLKKNMDLIDLFIGQEGTLGIITEVEIYLLEPKEEFLYLTVFLTNGKEIKLVTDIKKSKILKTIAIEYFDPNSIRLLKQYREQMGEASNVPPLHDKIKSAIYLEISFIKDTFNEIYKELCSIFEKNHININLTWASFSKKDHDMMKKFRHALPERINSLIAQRKQQIKELTKVATDMAVPDKYLASIFNYYNKELKKYSLDYYIFGHIGNSHLHVNILPKNLDELKLAKSLYKKFAKKVVRYGGSVSAEHGIGKIKRDFLLIQYKKREIQIMKNIKKQLDPKNILNPEVLFY